MTRTTQKRVSRCVSDSRTVRSAFTLVEILVVIAIIGILMALAVPALFRWIGTQAIKDTKAKVEGIDAIFHQHWKKVIDEAKAESRYDLFMVNQLAGGDSNRAKAIWIKVRLVEAFPINFGEISNPWVYQTDVFYKGSPPLIPPGKRKYLATYYKTLNNSGSHNPNTEMAACLLMALSVNRGVADVNDALKYKADIDNDGIQELVDDWKQPLAFFRFPTNNADLQNACPTKTNFRDPLDPEGTLLNASWYNTSVPGVNPIAPNWGTAFGMLFHPVSASVPQIGQAPPAAYYTIPVIVSAGPDQSLGLNADMSVASAAANDNLFSFKLKVGSGTN